MPPVTVAPSRVKWHLKSFTLIHILLFNAVTVAAVFTAIAGGRDVGTGKKSIPVKRLSAFGGLLVIYTAVKSWEVALKPAWYNWKRVLDWLSLCCGFGSFAVLISCTAVVFALSVVVPICCISFGFSLAFAFWGDRIMEFFYRVVLLHTQKWLFGTWNRWVKGEEAKNASDCKWNGKIQESKDRMEALRKRAEEESKQADADLLSIVVDGGGCDGDGNSGKGLAYYVPQYLLDFYRVHFSY